MLNLIKPVIIFGAAFVGTGVGVFTAVKDTEEDDKDSIIEDLSNRYNELVDSINNGTLDLDDLEDVDVDEEDEDDEEENIDTDEDDDEEEEPVIQVADDEPELEFYPRQFILDCDAATDHVQNLYTDIENCNDGYITFYDDELLEEVKNAIVMLCTAYQIKYMSGIDYYIDLLSYHKIVEIRRISNYDSSVKRNKEALITSINVCIQSAKKLREALETDFLNRRYDAEEFEAEQLENEEEDDTDYVVPVHHKECKKEE